MLPRRVTAARVRHVLLIASSRRTSRSIIRALNDAGFAAVHLRQAGLFHPVSVKVGVDEEHAALGIARAVDPSVQNR